MKTPLRPLMMVAVFLGSATFSMSPFAAGAAAGAATGEGDSKAAVGTTESSADDNAKPTAFEKEMTKWRKTGNKQRCLMLTSVDSHDAWDDQHILFRMKGGKAWLNTLPQSCPRLGFEGRFIHKTTMNQICDLDLITVFDPMSNIPGPSCGLGLFEEVEKVDAGAEK